MSTAPATRWRCWDTATGMTKLGGETSVLNQPIRINGQVFTVVGVAPKGFTGTTLGD